MRSAVKSDDREDEEVLDRLANDDRNLRRITPGIIEERRRLGLQGLVGGLQAVVINTEPERQWAAVEELSRHTGLDLAGGFEDGDKRTWVLKTPGYPEFPPADFLITSRLRGESPFRGVNRAPKSAHLPDTRLECFVFETPDIERYVEIQRARGIGFLGDTVHKDNFSFIQTPPSPYTGNSLGFIQWTGERGEYDPGGNLPGKVTPEVKSPEAARLEATRPETTRLEAARPEMPHRDDIRWLDHAATRVKAQDRDAAIVEFMNLTSYSFDMAIYISSLNSITSVARLSPEDFAMVFTSGISPYVSDEVSGPTEKFIRNYGTRVHHIAFQTEEIEDTYQALVDDGMRFLIELVGSPAEGLKQTFSMPSENTLLVNEYIHRYGDFDGFFTKSNVTLLTEATGRQ